MTRYAFLNFSILLVIFSQKWVTEGSNPGVNFFQNFHCMYASVILTSRMGVRPSFRPIRCIWQEILDFEISNFTCVFSQEWVTEGSNPGVNFFEKFHCKDTGGLFTLNKGAISSFRSIRCIWQEIMDFEFSNFTYMFSQKWVTEGSTLGVALFKTCTQWGPELPSHHWRVPKWFGRYCT
jgi:hypothetical protein